MMTRLFLFAFACAVTMAQITTYPPTTLLPGITDNGTDISIPTRTVKIGTSPVGSSAFKLRYLSTGGVAGEPDSSYLSQGPVLEAFGPNGDYFRISRYPYGWALRAHAGAESMCCFEMYLPGALS